MRLLIPIPADALLAFFCKCFFAVAVKLFGYGLRRLALVALTVFAIPGAAFDTWILCLFYLAHTLTLNSLAASLFLILLTYAYSEIKSPPLSPVAKSAHWPDRKLMRKLPAVLSCLVGFFTTYSLPSTCPPGIQFGTRDFARPSNTRFKFR